MCPKFVHRRADVRSLVGRSGSRAFQTIHQYSVEVARELTPLEAATGDLGLTTRAVGVRRKSEASLVLGYRDDELQLMLFISC